MDNINNLISKIYIKEFVIALLASKIVNKTDKNISIIKIKNPKNIHNFDNYDIRLRKSKEIN